MANWTLEDNVNDWVKSEFARIKQPSYTVESAMSDCLKDAIQRGVIVKRAELEEAGETEKGKSWKPDFELEIFSIPVIIENKLGLSKLYAGNEDRLKRDIKSTQNYAVNGAIHYAQCAIMSKKYSEVVAIGIAGDSADNVSVKVYYVYGSTDETYKLVANYTTLDFLGSKKSFAEFYKEATLTEDEKHKILIDSQAKLQEYAKKLNKLMHNHSITAPQRVLYVSGMLLAMQDIADIKEGLVPSDLKGINLDNQRDGDIIVNQTENYLKLKNIPQSKRNLMLASFKEINKDSDRDKPIELDSIVGKLLPNSASVNNQIFTYIYENIFLSIDSMSGHLDIMGEMYSEFLKYALGDGKEIGIVLTPPYITKMMAQILDVDKDSKVMDLATGSAGFLISSMQMMIEDAERKYGKKTDKAIAKIEQIKKEQLLGVELNAEMFTLASTNMILRGDGSSNIRKGSSFSEPLDLYKTFKATKLLLNPPFSFKENGMPFIRFGLENMQIGGQAAIIIQDSAGSGRAIESCQSILKKNQLLASIKMPVDLFMPMAGVQTSIYILEHTNKSHDYKKQVKFIDFRNDGYKRTKRSLNEISNPIQRYNDIVEIYKNGATAVVSSDLWNLKQQVVMDVITDKGNDWNYDLHQKNDSTPTIEDFKETVSDYLAWEVSNILKRQSTEGERGLLGKVDTLLNEKLESVKWGEYKLGDLFEVNSSKKRFDANKVIISDLGKPYVVRTSLNNGIRGYINKDDEFLNEGNTISFGQDTATMFYQDKPYFTGDKIKILKSKNKKFNIKNAQFFILTISKAFSLFSWGGSSFSVKIIKNQTIQLPVKNGNIDFVFMESFIAELEAEHIADLEAYLSRYRTQRLHGSKKNQINKI